MWPAPAVRSPITVPRFSICAIRANISAADAERLSTSTISVPVNPFFDGFATGARANVHAKVLYGRSSHHHVEAVFKAFARALRVACARDARLAKMPTTALKTFACSK